MCIEEGLVCFTFVSRLDLKGRDLVEIKIKIHFNNMGKWIE